MQHIQTQHPDIISRYGTTMSGVGQNITLILADPTYVGYHNASIEYMKTMSTGETLKVAVRASKNGTLFVRSIYLISPEDIQRFLQHGRLKAPDKFSISNNPCCVISNAPSSLVVPKRFLFDLRSLKSLFRVADRKSVV